MLLAEDGLPLLLERYAALPRGDRARIRRLLPGTDRAALDRHIGCKAPAAETPVVPFAPALMARIAAASDGRPIGCMTQTASAALLRAASAVAPAAAVAAGGDRRSLVDAVIHRIRGSITS